MGKTESAEIPQISGSVIDMSTRQTMTVPQVALVLGMSRAKLDQLIVTGECPIPLLPGLGKRRRFATVAVAAYLRGERLSA
jgi:predicted DNA-binding transcriptional regulator AlpA